MRTVLVAAALSLFAPVSADAQAAVVRDSALDALIGTSLVSSPLLAARRNDLAASRSDVDVARWQYFPSISADLQQGTGSASQNPRVVRIDQKLYTGGRLDADVRSASARSDGTALGVRESALSLALQIVGAYQSVVTAIRQIAAIESYRVRLDALDGTISRRIESGVSAAADRSLINARITQSQNELTTARAAQRSALATLHKLVGAPAAVDAVAPRFALETATPQAGPASVCSESDRAERPLEEALDRSPTLQRIAKEVEAARANVDSQRAGLKPVLGVRLEQPIAPSADSGLRSTRLSVFIQYTPDAGLAGLARTEGATARVASLLDQADAMRRELIQQIRSECADQGGLIDRVAGLSRARGFTTEVVESSRRLFVAGRRGWIDLLNSAREDFDAEQASIAAAAALNASAYRLALLTGDYPLPTPGLAEPATGALNSLKAWVR